MDHDDGYRPEAILYSRPSQDGGVDYLVRKPASKSDHFLRDGPDGGIPIAPDLLPEGARHALSLYSLTGWPIVGTNADDHDGQAEEEEVDIEVVPGGSHRHDNGGPDYRIADIPPYRGPEAIPTVDQADLLRPARAGSAPPSSRPNSHRSTFTNASPASFLSSMIFSRGGVPRPHRGAGAGGAGGAPSPVPAKRSAAMQSAAEKVRRKTAKYLCELCGRDFTRRANLKSHQDTHKNLRPFQCARCPRAFVRRHELKRHETLHETAPDGVVRWGGIRTKKADLVGGIGDGIDDGGQGQGEDEDEDEGGRRKRARVEQEGDVPVIDPDLAI